MHKIFGIFLLFVAMFLLLLGMVFIIAGETENLVIGGFMVLISMILIILVFYDSRNQARKPTMVRQTIEVSMGASGEFTEKELTCKSCGGAIGEENVKLIEGGLMVNCPYCGKVSTLEEEPKW